MFALHFEIKSKCPLLCKHCSSSPIREIHRRLKVDAPVFDLLKKNNYVNLIITDPKLSPSDMEDQIMRHLG